MIDAGLYSIGAAARPRQDFGEAVVLTSILMELSPLGEEKK